MVTYDTSAVNKGPSTKEETIILGVLRDFSSLQNERSTWNGHCEDVADVILPSHSNTFYFGSMNTPGEKKTQQQVDATGMLALSRFAAICDSLLTPRNMIWHGLEGEEGYLKKDRQTRLWCETATKILFKYRYATVSNFAAQNQAIFQSLGAFGTGVLFIDKFFDIRRARPQLRYKAIPMGEIYLTDNHQGLYNGFIRIIRLTAAQMAEVKEWEGKLPPQVLTALEQNSQTKFVTLQRVKPRTDYDPDAIDARGTPYYSCYVSMEGKCLLSEGGYYSFPIAASRYQQAPGERDGRGVAMDVLPSLRTLNAEKRTFLKQGHRAADPVLLTYDDGLMSLSLKPGALNKGGWSSDGKPLVGTLPSGEIQITLEMMQEEKSIIQDAFLTSLFQVIFDNPSMTATQVIEIVNQKGILIAPTVGRQQGEYLGPMIDRELDLLASMRVLPEMPPLMREARGAYSVNYTSPLAKAMRAGEAAGFFRTLEGVKEIVAITGDLAPLDNFNFDVAIPDIADIQSVPTSWMSSPQEIEGKRRNRAEGAARQEQIQAAPAAAAMMKAEAAAAQAGTR